MIADSDMEVGPDYLANVVAELQRPGVGAVSCLYHGVSEAGIWSRHAALAINGHFLPSAVLALSLRLARPCFGSTIALRRGTLARIGGFEAFADCLADDYMIGAAVRSAGYAIAIPSFSIGHRCFEDSLRTLLAHELRAARTIRSLHPFGYCGAIITHPFPLALIGALCSNGNALLLAAISFACRGLLCRCVEYRFELPRQPYWLMPFRDLLSFAVFVSSFFGATVTWRGVSYHVSTGGRLAPERNSVP